MYLTPQTSLFSEKLGSTPSRIVIAYRLDTLGSAYSLLCRTPLIKTTVSCFSSLTLEMHQIEKTTKSGLFYFLFIFIYFLNAPLAKL